jgi:large-conductance mechanosensitive channel
MGLGIVIVGSAFHHPATSFLTRLVPLLAQLAAGGLVFAAAVRVLRVQEIAIAYNLIVRKLEPSAAA